MRRLASKVFGNRKDLTGIVIAKYSGISTFLMAVFACRNLAYKFPNKLANAAQIVIHKSDRFLEEIMNSLLLPLPTLSVLESEPFIVCPEGEISLN